MTQNCADFRRMCALLAVNASSWQIQVARHRIIYALSSFKNALDFKKLFPIPYEKPLLQCDGFKPMYQGSERCAGTSGSCRLTAGWG
jgi:hypothetical protein